MTTLLERPRSTEPEDQSASRKASGNAPTIRKAKGIRAWVASLVAVAVVAAGAVVVSLNQADAADPLAYRAIGEAEALERFASSSVVPGLSYRSIGEVEALQRFASSSVVPGLSYRSIGEVEALQRFTTG